MTTEGPLAAASDPAEPGYRIGAVTRLTGIQTDTLRMWERRYQVVTPRRTETANRLYSHHDIARLSLIKSLVDAGHAIGTIAGLSLEQLQTRVGYQPRNVSSPQGDFKAPQVAVLGDTLAAQFAVTPPRAEGVDWVLASRDRENFPAAARAAGAQVLVLELPTVMADAYVTVQRILSQSGAEHAVLVYGFGTRKSLKQLIAANCTVLRAPAGPEELRMACLRAVGRSPDAAATLRDRPEWSAPAPRRYTAEALVRAASFAARVECECPQHISDLIQSLNAFEDYSAACINRNDEDALLHAFLHSTTSQARALMEAALERVARAEGIDLAAVPQALETSGNPT